MQERKTRKRNCSKCGADGWVSNGEGYFRCGPCRDTYKSNYYQVNRCKVDSKNKEWAEDNQDKHKIIAKRWRDKNPQSIPNYKAAKKMATPSWVDKDIVRDFYIEAKYHQMQVDHIVPLQSDKVCGLHWEGNMQLLSRSENAAKSNRYWEDM